MFTRSIFRSLTLSASFALAAGAVTGCEQGYDSSDDNIVDVQHTDVERQSIGNCWLYAQSTWIESMHLSATGEKTDLSQSYFTYWHWFDQITSAMYSSEIETGGGQWKSNAIVRDRGMMLEGDFVKEDATSEMSQRQAQALAKINTELKTGRLKTSEARRDGKKVRQVLDEAWGLESGVRSQLDKVFGKDGESSLRYGAKVTGTKVIDPATFAVRYTKYNTTTKKGDVLDTNLVQAISDWREASYPNYGSASQLKKDRRNFQIRVQRALHDRQPVVITWDVDFNAMENMDEALRGSFNMTTLKNAGSPGHQGGHMTVLEDYQAKLSNGTVLEAGTTLDPSKPADKALLDKALLKGTTIQFFRVKNSWGSLRPDREFAPGFPGYHDLYMDYLNGPIKFCPDVEGANNDNCTGETIPFNSVMLPPGY
jgi:hypothetical protein